MNAIKGDYIAVLDIGSSKIACFVARLTANPGLKSDFDKLSALNIVAAASVPSAGVREGSLTDMAATEAAVRKALDKVEETVNDPIDRVWINASAGFPRSDYAVASLQVGGAPLTKSRLDELHEKALRQIRKEGKYIAHAAPIFYTADGVERIVNPLDMRAETVGVQMLCVTADLPPLKNLGVCVEKCHVEIGGRAVTGYASGLGVLAPAEKKTGAICLDFGAETVSISAFYEDRLVYADMLPYGGVLVTRDIAQALGTPLEAAEMLKKTKGSAVFWVSDEKEMIEVPVISEEMHAPVFESFPRSALTKIIKPRCEEIIEKVRDRLQQAGFDLTREKTVITGGASQLTGFPETIARIFGARPRPASPIRFAGAPHDKSGPEYATCAGLLTYAVKNSDELPPEKLFSRFSEGKGLGRIFNWLKQNF